MRRRHISPALKYIGNTIHGVPTLPYIVFCFKSYSTYGIASNYGAI